MLESRVRLKQQRCLQCHCNYKSGLSPRCMVMRHASQSVKQSVRLRQQILTILMITSSVRRPIPMAIAPEFAFQVSTCRKRVLLVVRISNPRSTFKAVTGRRNGLDPKNFLVPATSRSDRFCPLVNALAGSSFLLIRFPCLGTADTSFPAGVQGHFLVTSRSLKFWRIPWSDASQMSRLSP